MMRLVFGLVAALGLAVTQVQPADACGVKLQVKAGKVKQTSRSSNPSKVLVLGKAPKRLSAQLSEAGHTVEVASSADRASGKDYKVVIVDADMQDAARAAYPGARIVARGDSTRDNLKAVEDGVVRQARGTMVARRPTNTGERRVKTFGPRPDDKAAPIATGGGDTVATVTPPATPDTPVVDKQPTVTPDPVRPVADKPPRPTTDVVVKPPRVKPPVATDEPAAERPVRTARLKFHKELSFGGGSSDLTGKVSSRLDADARWLAANPDKSITIEGHASQVGSAEVNQALSEARASAVKDYLVAQGVDASRIQVVGRGFEAPAYQPASSARNRRVKIVVNE